jgi:hypothetical protein
VRGIPGTAWVVLMAKGGVLARYKRLVEALGLRVLDIYRVSEKGKPKDVVRILDYATGKVVLVDLETTREALRYREFLERILGKLRESGVEVSDRIAGRVLEEASRLDALHASASEAGA